MLVNFWKMSLGSFWAMRLAGAAEAEAPRRQLGLAVLAVRQTGGRAPADHSPSAEHFSWGKALLGIDQLVSE